MVRREISTEGTYRIIFASGATIQARNANARKTAKHAETRGTTSTFNRSAAPDAYEKHTDKIGKVKSVAESVTQKNATHFFRKFFAGLSVFIAVIVFMPPAVSALFFVFASFFVSASLSVGIFSATALPLSLAFFSRKNTAFIERSSGGARKKMPATAEKESRKPASNTEIGEKTSTTIAAFRR